MHRVMPVFKVPTKNCNIELLVPMALSLVTSQLSQALSDDLGQTYRKPMAAQFFFPWTREGNKLVPLVNAPPLEVFMARVDGALSKLVL